MTSIQSRCTHELDPDLGPKLRGPREALPPTPVPNLPGQLVLKQPSTVVTATGRTKTAYTDKNHLQTADNSETLNVSSLTRP